MSLRKLKLGLVIMLSFLFGAVTHTLRFEEIGFAGGTTLDPVTAPDDEVSATSAANIIAAHTRSSRQYNNNCTGCHSQVFSEQSLNPAIHTAHVTMRAFVPGKEDNRKCVFCHRSVDLLERSAGNLRRQVDVAVCALCHGPGRATKTFYLTGPSLTNPDGPALYASACSPCHGALANSQVRGKPASEIQNKIRENEGGMGPLQLLTSTEIQAIARALVQ